jgi:hypothetical protein
MLQYRIEDGSHNKIIKKYMNFERKLLHYNANINFNKSV